MLEIITLQTQLKELQEKIKEAKNILTPNIVVETAANVFCNNNFQLDVRKIQSIERKSKIVNARCFISYYLHSIGYTVVEIGKLLNRDHSSISYLKNQHESRYNFEEDYRKLYDEFINLLYKREIQEKNLIQQKELDKQKQKDLIRKTGNALPKMTITAQFLIAQK